MRPVAVIAHGSGSSAAFVQRAAGPALAAAGFRLVAMQDRSGDVEQLSHRLAALADRYRAALVGGISLGAHAAVRVAIARPGLDGLVLLLPAWTGPAGTVARLSAAAADQVEADLRAGGMAAAVRRVGRSGWAGAELAASWQAYGAEGLVASLRATATSRGPTVGELRAVPCPAGVVAVRSDPFHPVEVAAAWARAIPVAALTVLAPSAPAADRGVLGVAAVAAWRRAATGAQASKR